MGTPTAWWIEGGDATEVPIADVATHLARARSGAGFVWVDLPDPQPHRELLRDVFGFHDKAIDDTVHRNHVSRVHAYRDHLLLILHRPRPGTGGHVHYLELDQFVGRHALVTTHGPRNPVVPAEELLVETRDIAARLRSGRLRPESPLALSYAVVCGLTNAEERIVNVLAEEVGLLEQRVMTQADDMRPQEFLDELFTARHMLLTVRTMAAQSAEVYARATRLSGDLPKGDLHLLVDLKDQYHRLARITGSQLDFLEGVTDFYRARTDTRMTIAAERLAVIAAITLPITAVSSVVGMNVIVNSETHWGWLVVLLVLMTTMSLVLLRWARRQGWW